MKNTVLSILIIGLACTVSGCKSKDDINVNHLSVANPYVQVESVSTFETELGLQLSLPTDAMNMSYFIINKRIAEVNFSLDETYYTYRASNKVKDNLSGIYEKTVLCEQFYINNTLEVNIITTEADIKYALWSINNTHYSLSMTSIMENDHILSLIQNSIN